MLLSIILTAALGIGLQVITPTTKMTIDKGEICGPMDIGVVNGHSALHLDANSCVTVKEHSKS